MIASLSRTLRQNIHAASSCILSNGNLALYEHSGVEYIYLVNANHQVIRNQAGGGTAVISARVGALTATQMSGIVYIKVQLVDGTSANFSAQLGGRIG